MYEVSLLVLKIFHLFEYFSTLKEKFRISAQPCNILYLSMLLLGESFVSVNLQVGEKTSLVPFQAGMPQMHSRKQTSFPFNS